MGDEFFDLFPGGWLSEFYTSRHSRRLLVEDKSYVVTRRTNNSSHDDWSIFWVTCEEDIPFHIGLKELFPTDVSLYHLQHGTGGSDESKSAWLDDREYLQFDPKGERRLYQGVSSHSSRLTPAKLYECLSEDVSTSAVAR
jgi:hypothetical protein